MYSNRYTLAYATGVTVAVAVVLALASSSLGGLQAANVRRAQQIAILETVMDAVNPETLEADYAAYVDERVLDYAGRPVDGVAAVDVDARAELRTSPEDRLYPVYVFERDGETRYIVPIEGNGLWGGINAFLALQADRDTIAGVVFDHETETPGLGAEIATAEFQDRFRGKRLFADGGEFASVEVLKGAGNDVTGDPHRVDGLTGATMTTRGVTEMFRDELSLYNNVFEGMDP